MSLLMPAPMPSLTSLRKEMDRLFERAFDGDHELPSFVGWMPPLDLSETDELITLKMEIPGIDPKDVQVHLKGQLLIIRGEKRRETERKDERFYRVERSYGSFARTIQLPSMVREEKVNATFKNGLLTITLSKVPEAIGTSIPIKIS